MSALDDALAALCAHNEVRTVLILGRDGLLIQQRGEELDGETISAMIPGLATAADALGRAAGAGGFRTAALQMQEGVAVLATLGTELLLAALVRPAVGFEELLRDIAARRADLTALV